MVRSGGRPSSRFSAIAHQSMVTEDVYVELIPASVLRGAPNFRPTAGIAGIVFKPGACDARALPTDSRSVEAGGGTMSALKTGGAHQTRCRTLLRAGFPWRRTKRYLPGRCSLLPIPSFGGGVLCVSALTPWRIRGAWNGRSVGSTPTVGTSTVLLAMCSADLAVVLRAGARRAGLWSGGPLRAAASASSRADCLS